MINIVKWNAWEQAVEIARGKYEIICLWFVCLKVHNWPTSYEHRKLWSPDCVNTHKQFTSFFPGGCRMVTTWTPVHQKFLTNRLLYVSEKIQSFELLIRNLIYEACSKRDGSIPIVTGLSWSRFAQIDLELCRVLITFFHSFIYSIAWIDNV